MATCLGLQMKIKIDESVKPPYKEQKQFFLIKIDGVNFKIVYLWIHGEMLMIPFLQKINVINCLDFLKTP